MTPLKRWRQARPILRAAYAGLLTVGLASCGGGGGGGDGAGSNVAGTPSAASLNSVPTTLATTTSSVPGYLILSEVATNFYSNDSAWVEVYNPGSTSVSLSRYTLRTTAINPTTATTAGAPVTFTLPAVDVPPQGHVVIAARVADKFLDNSQMVYVRNGNHVPFWQAHGALELLSDGITADFVRFGTSATAPAASTAWSGNNVAALPSAGDQHGKSIVRLAAAGMADTNSAADWALVNFATPAGRNDVAPGVVDSDADGIPDSAKVNGGTYGGLDLYAMGARAGRRDIFVEIDYMASADPGTTPRLEALQKIESTFAARGIALHMDAGTLYSAGFDPVRFNLGGGNPVAFAPCVDLDSVGGATRSGCSSFMATKSAHFDVRRKLLFHYALFGNSLKTDGTAGSSGIAELNGNDLIVALGGYGFTTDSGSNLNMLVNLQASTLMHELGHNLGLRHGGNENVNYKPNHYSVMNYMYQFAGLSATPNSVHAAERYYLANGLKGMTNLCSLVENSPCGDQFIISYSDGSGADLDENMLLETVNIGRGAAAGAYADWDGNGGITAGAVAWNINPRDELSPTLRSVLRDYNEWANLSLPFSRNYSGSVSGNTLQEVSVTQPRNGRMKERKRERIVEEPLPEHLHTMIRHMTRHRH